MQTQKCIEEQQFKLFISRKKLGIISRISSKDYELVKQGAKHLQAEDEILEDNVKITSSVVDNYWYRRREEARRLVCFQLFTNGMF